MRQNVPQTVLQVRRGAPIAWRSERLDAPRLQRYIEAPRRTVPVTLFIDHAKTTHQLRLAL